MQASHELVRHEFFNGSYGGGFLARLSTRAGPKELLERYSENGKYLEVLELMSSLTHLDSEAALERKGSY